MKKDTKIMVFKDGPYFVSGGLSIDKQIIGVGKEGEAEKWIQGKKVPSGETYALCRCGESKSKPFCDGTHGEVNFNGTETASKKPHDKQAKVMDGPTLKLEDAPALCADARFCHRGGGTRELTHHSDEPKARELAIEEACQCPSGRLVESDKKTGKVFEKEFVQSISLVEDPQNKVSGPIALRGGILVESSDGTTYEVRNRQTLCRCGKSQNKPFCDGSHIDEGFNDGDDSLKWTNKATSKKNETACGSYCFSVSFFNKANSNLVNLSSADKEDFPESSAKWSFPWMLYMSISMSTLDVLTHSFHRDLESSNRSLGDTLMELESEFIEDMDEFFDLDLKSAIFKEEYENLKEMDGVNQNVQMLKEKLNSLKTNVVLEEQARVSRAILVLTKKQISLSTKQTQLSEEQIKLMAKEETIDRKIMVLTEISIITAIAAIIFSTILSELPESYRFSAFLTLSIIVSSICAFTYYDSRKKLSARLRFYFGKKRLKSINK